MKRCFVSFAALMMLASLARGHFIWIVPDRDGKSAQVFFSDNLTPDEAKLLAKIASTEVFLRSVTGPPEGAFNLVPTKTTPLKWTKDTDRKAYVVTASGQGPRWFWAVCNYGVVQRGKSEPFLLKYYAKAFLGGIPSEEGAIAGPGHWDRLPLEIRRTKFGDCRVLWNGKPLAGADVAILAPGEDTAQEMKTDAAGEIKLKSGKSGLHAIRARHIEKKSGKHDGKEYKEARYYSTLVFRAEKTAKNDAVPVKADPAASKLLADARSARATWKNFPGFTAEVAVNFDGKVSKGKVHVAKEGKVRLEGLDAAFEPWAKRELASLVGHRLDSGTPRDTPCAFVDSVEDHPFGRAIRVLNDELHSSYRIRGKEIVVVNRTMKDRRFTITVLESIANAEGKLLTTSFVVDYWHLDTGELVRSDATSQTWKRVGQFDLPAVTRIVTAAREKKAESDRKEEGYTAKSLALSSHKLLGGAVK